MAIASLTVRVRILDTPKPLATYCYVRLIGYAPGQRIGIVKLNETGYFPVDFEAEMDLSDEAVAALVKDLNRYLNIPPDVCESMEAASMFGWHTPAAREALQFFGR